MPTLTLLATVTIAVLTAILTGLSLIVTKENKISEFRQDWINSQRADLATAIAAAWAYRDETNPEKRVGHLFDFDAAHARIELRENPDKNEWTNARAALDRLRAEIAPGPATDPLQGLRAEILGASCWPLKRNWTVVKSGEVFFKAFKWGFVAFLGVIAFSIALGAYVGIPPVAPPADPGSCPRLFGHAAPLSPLSPGRPAIRALPPAGG